MVVALRHSKKFKDYVFEKFYGVLKTYEPETNQVKEIERNQKMTSLLPSQECKESESIDLKAIECESK